MQSSRVRHKRNNQLWKTCEPFTGITAAAALPVEQGSYHANLQPPAWYWYSIQPPAATAAVCRPPVLPYAADIAASSEANRLTPLIEYYTGPRPLTPHGGFPDCNLGSLQTSPALLLLKERQLGGDHGLVNLPYRPPLLVLATASINICCCCCCCWSSSSALLPAAASSCIGGEPPTGVIDAVL